MYIVFWWRDNNGEAQILIFEFLVIKRSEQEYHSSTSINHNSIAIENWRFGERPRQSYKNLRYMWIELCGTFLISSFHIGFRSYLINPISDCFHERMKVLAEDRSGAQESNRITNNESIAKHKWEDLLSCLFENLFSLLSSGMHRNFSNCKILQTNPYKMDGKTMCWKEGLTAMKKKWLHINPHEWENHFTIFDTYHVYLFIFSSVTSANVVWHAPIKRIEYKWFSKGIHFSCFGSTIKSPLIQYVVDSTFIFICIIFRIAILGKIEKVKLPTSRNSPRWSCEIKQK